MTADALASFLLAVEMSEGVRQSGAWHDIYASADIRDCRRRRLSLHIVEARRSA